MKTEVLLIGVVDKDNSVHAVELCSGVNIITGRSSTGKSALIEIFDYCFGSDDFTVPEGVITEHADIYFVVLKIKEENVVLARKRDDNKAFIKKETIEIRKDLFNTEYFRKDYFLPLLDYKKELRKYYGAQLQITDANESANERFYKNGRKNPTPSIRSFTSFILQHQNLIANKHAIFYRFDQKEKREQVIDHFKVFAGFADQEYFLKMQEIEKLESEKRIIELQIPKKSEIKEKIKYEVKSLLMEYLADSGKILDIGKIDDLFSNPKEILEILNNHKIEVISISEEHIKQKQEYERVLARLTAEYRNEQHKLDDIQSSIKFAESYQKDTSTVIIPRKEKIHASECPFCNSYNSKIEQQANKLSNAIKWLNDELQRSEYSIESFKEDERNSKDRLKEIGVAIAKQEDAIESLKKRNEELAKNKTQYELSLKVKLKIENIIEKISENPFEELENRLSELRNEIGRIKNYLSENYNVGYKLRTAEQEINTFMQEISQFLEFEDSYKPINLHFSLETFDLWNQMNNRKIYLRAMGSGANWLSCHITLFLALNRYFCSLNDSCSIPTMLFLDQPSQVYFPSILDNDEEFSAEVIAEKEGDTRMRNIDDDITAVTELYTELVNYCKDTKEKTGIEPQIIVTDHADKLKICGDTTNETFEKLVRARWRKKDEGFINIQREL